jgi:thymidylate synthase (FAD)
VSRAFTQQLQRTRIAKYAQQTLRLLDASNFDYHIGPSVLQNPEIKSIYENTMDYIDTRYKEMLEKGAHPEDARGVLPFNILTSEVMKINMRNFIDLTRKRSTLRVQDEYRRTLDQMVMCVEKVYPWFYIFYKKDAMSAANKLDEKINNMDLDKQEKADLFKLIDQMRKEL